MDSIKHACTLNNQGVDLLVSGDSVRAMRSFQTGLSLLKEAANEVNEVETETICMTSQEVKLPLCESTSSVPGLEGLHCYVYDHGIMITDTTNGDSDEMLSLFCAILLFNLALASHLEGRLGSEKSLKKASMLYTMTLELLTSAPMPDDMSATVLILLALNNKAQIHYEQCEYSDADDCLKEISSIMCSVQGLHSTLNHKDVEGLLLNVMLLNAPTAAQAA
jgi:hypothetical protein